MIADRDKLWLQQSKNFPWYSSVEASGIFISFAVPCYNEENNIIDTLREIIDCMEKVGKTFEIIVIDDCSTDRTAEVTLDFIKNNPNAPVMLRRNLVNQGWAQNFVDGAFVSRGRYYRMIPGDNVEKSDQIRKVVELAGRADIIIPYQSVVEGQSIFRKILSKIYTRIVNLLSGFNLKYYNGCGLYSTFDIMRWHVNCSGFGFQAEILTRLLQMGKSYIEVEVHAQERSTGQSKALSIRNLLSVSFSLFKILVNRLKKLIFKISN